MIPFVIKGAKLALPACAIAALFTFALPCSAQDTSSSTANTSVQQESMARENKALANALRKIDSFQPLNSGDRAALKSAARKMTLPALRVCADPGDMPITNDQQQGYWNKILDILAKAMNTHVEYFWRPYIERGMLRETFGNDKCDVLVDLPMDYEGVVMSDPVYKTTFVLAYKSERNYNFTNFDDPRLKKLKIGVYQISAIRQVLAQHRVKDNVDILPVSHDADINPKHQPSYQVQQMIDGQYDVVGVWGPFAGYYKAVKKAPITLQPVNMMEDNFPLEYELGLGVQPQERILKYKIDLALNDTRAEIQKVLNDYGVPLVKCSECVIEGDLPAHGPYTQPMPTPPADNKPTVSLDQLKQWLAQGADVNEELDNAVLAADMQRVNFLLSKGADVNKRNEQGDTPLNIAVLQRDPELVKVLVEHHSDVNARGSDGMTPLLESVMQDDVPTLKILTSHGADLEARTSDGATPLAFAIAEDKMKAALALIDAGADVNSKSSNLGLTPLMVAAGREPYEISLSGQKHELENVMLDPHYPDALQVARVLIAHKADVNAVSTSGVTALMLAAAHNNTPIVGLLLQSGADASKKSPDGKTALDLATENGNDTVVSLIRLMQQANGGK
ncbi:MAG TPA: quinoprotein dehydrogenase-associated putative ABC transporter substrate-binding protein [Methylovirgula sp.]|nr:quinoprotein dehydrogenase-associated putative ABC transporter substrate-binding protein [Methylovirgula sp.]